MTESNACPRCHAMQSELDAANKRIEELTEEARERTAYQERMVVEQDRLQEELDNLKRRDEEWDRITTELRNELDAAHSAADSVLRAVVMERDAAEKRAGELEGALRKYGAHLAGAYCAAAHHPHDECSCGLGELLSRLGGGTT